MREFFHDEQHGASFMPFPIDFIEISVLTLERVMGGNGGCAQLAFYYV